MNKKKICLIIAFIVFVGILVTVTIIYNGNNQDKEVLETEAVDVGIIRINDDNYESETSISDKIVVLDFYENMCPPCTSMIPTLINIAKNSEKVKVAMVNISVEDTSNLSNKYQVSATPTIVILKNGEEIKRFVGATNEGDIMSVIDKEMEKSNEK